jgi:hypothetical protein
VAVMVILEEEVAITIIVAVAMIIVVEKTITVKVNKSFFKKLFKIFVNFQ